MDWLLPAICLANAVMAAAIWPKWLSVIEHGEHLLTRIFGLVMLFACFFGSLSLAFLAGLAVR